MRYIAIIALLTLAACANQRAFEYHDSAQPHQRQVTTNTAAQETGDFSSLLGIGTFLFRDSPPQTKKQKKPQKCRRSVLRDERLTNCLGF